MKLTSKKFAMRFLFAILSLLLVLAGCSQNSSTGASKNASTQKSGDKKYAGVEIKVGVEAGGPAPEFYKTIVKEFTKKTGIKVQFIDVPGQKMHDTFITDAISGTGGFDVYNMDEPWIPEFAAKGFIQPLDNLVDKQDLTDFFPSALNTVKYQDKLYALPYLVHTPVIYYRTDLFAKAGIKEPAKTIEEYRQQAKLLTDPSQGIYGTIIEGQQSAEPATELTDWVLQHNGMLLDKNNKVMVDSPQVLNTFKTLLGMQYDDKSSPPGAVNYTNTDVQNLFMQGKVAMVRNWPYMYSMAKDPSQSKVAGKFKVAIQPGTSADWSWSFGVASTSKNKEAAFEFVQWATSSDVVSRFAKKVLNPVPRKSSLASIKAAPNLSKDDIEALTVMTNAVNNGQGVPLDKTYESFRDRLAVTLSRIMTRQVKPEQELKSSQSDLQKIADGQ